MSSKKSSDKSTVKRVAVLIVAVLMILGAIILPFI